MYKLPLVCFALCLPLSLISLAESTVYQTSPKPAHTSSQKDWSVPVISINPDTGKTRVFITPDGSFSSSLASHGAPVYHARALYDPTSTGISDSTIALHRQMVDICPQGWIKLQEWANLHTDTQELHYQFQCLEP